MFLETGPMRDQAAQRDGNTALRRRNGEVDVTVDVAVEIEPACVHESCMTAPCSCRGPTRIRLSLVTVQCSSSEVCATTRIG